jgi:hypothetical protein
MFCKFLLSSLRFKLKYHPEDSAKRRSEQKAMLMKRVDVFMDFYNKKKFDQVQHSQYFRGFML